MAKRTNIKVAVTLVVGISLVFLLPALQLLPATTRAWRRALALLPSVRTMARSAAQLPALMQTSLFAIGCNESTCIPVDIVSLDCARLC
jgi:hypothetical protein